MARIVATSGPASESNLETTLQYGTIRLNMAFMGPENYDERIK